MTQIVLGHRSFALGMGCIKALEHSETDTKEPIEKKTSYYFS